MPKIVAGLMAIAGLGASLLAGVDPAGCLLRGAVAYGAGILAANLWCAFFHPQTVDIPRLKAAEPGTPKHATEQPEPEAPQEAKAAA